MFRDARVQPGAEMVEKADLRVRSLFQAWQLMGSSRKLWYAMANQMPETDTEVAGGTGLCWRKTEVTRTNQKVNCN